jgi:hypothetical protein
LFLIQLQVSEILDSELWGEGLIPIQQHAHDMLLVDNPLTVPYRATTYGQVFERTIYCSFSFSLFCKYFGNLISSLKMVDYISIVGFGIQSSYSHICLCGYAFFTYTEDGTKLNVPAKGAE